MWACRCDAFSEAGIDVSNIALKIAAYIAIHLRKVSAISSLRNLSLKMLTLVLRDPRLTLKTELAVFKSACAWVTNQSPPGTDATDGGGEAQVSGRTGLSPSLWQSLSFLDLCACVRSHTHTHTHTHTCTCTCTCVPACMHARLYVCTRVCSITGLGKPPIVSVPKCIQEGTLEGSAKEPARISLLKNAYAR
jgi:hypothetical protein